MARLKAVRKRKEYQRRQLRLLASLAWITRRLKGATALSQTKIKARSWRNWRKSKRRESLKTLSVWNDRIVAQAAVTQKVPMRPPSRNYREVQRSNLVLKTQWIKSRTQRLSSFSHRWVTQNQKTVQVLSLKILTPRGAHTKQRKANQSKRLELRWWKELVENPEESHRNHLGSPSLMAQDLRKRKKDKYQNCRLVKIKSLTRKRLKSNRNPSAILKLMSQIRYKLS